jgi:hypothetical protein
LDALVRASVRTYDNKCEVERFVEAGAGLDNLDRIRRSTQQRRCLTAGFLSAALGRRIQGADAIKAE